MSNLRKQIAEDRAKIDQYQGITDRILALVGVLALATERRITDLVKPTEKALVDLIQSDLCGECASADREPSELWGDGEEGEGDAAWAKPSAETPEETLPSKPDIDTQRRLLRHVLDSRGYEPGGYLANLARFVIFDNQGLWVIIHTEHIVSLFEIATIAGYVFMTRSMDDEGRIIPIKDHLYVRAERIT